MSRLAVLTALALGAVGCSSSSPSAAPTLVVTLDGQPVAGLLVQLVGPDGKGVASGTTDAAGQAVVRAGGGEPPAAGAYKVVLADTGEAEENPMEPAKKAGKSRVPTTYGKAATTTASVTLDGTPRSHPVELKSK